MGAGGDAGFVGGLVELFEVEGLEAAGVADHECEVFAVRRDGGDEGASVESDAANRFDLEPVGFEDPIATAKAHPPNRGDGHQRHRQREREAFAEPAAGGRHEKAALGGHRAQALQVGQKLFCRLIAFRRVLQQSPLHDAADTGRE